MLQKSNDYAIFKFRVIKKKGLRAYFIDTWSTQLIYERWVNEIHNGRTK